MMQTTLFSSVIHRLLDESRFVSTVPLPTALSHSCIGDTNMYLSKMIDNVFDSVFNESLHSFGMPVDFYTSVSKSDKDQYLIELVVPGLSREDTEILVKNDILSVKYLKSPHRMSTKGSHWRLPDDVDVESIVAECKNGILTITLPRLSKNTETVKKISIV